MSSKVKRLIAVLTLVVALSCTLVLVSVMSVNVHGASLVWSDEFSGSSLNTANWNFDIGNNGWGNGEWQYYTDRTQNVSVGDGCLKISALKENYGGSAYTSGRIKTQGKKSWKYGTIEARMALPQAQGVWPAFWMIGDSFSSVGWPKCGEIDIMEHVNWETSIVGSMHWDNNGTYSLWNGRSGTLNVWDWHTYKIDWSATGISWYVDGVKYREGNITNNINGTEEFHKNFFIILNVAVGGNWPGAPDGNGFPANMWVDYVRVYQ